MRHTTDPQRPADRRGAAATRRLGLVALIAAAMLGLVACGGLSGPRVASLPARSTGASAAPTRSTGATRSPSRATRSNGGKSSANRSAKGDPIRLLSEWTACMRSHGDPEQAQPTIDASGAIHVVEPAGYFGPMFGPTGHSSTGAGVTCLAYLTGASTSLLGGELLRQPDPANPKSPGFEKAAKACAQKVPLAASLGGPATLQRGQIEIDKADGQVALIFA